MCQNFTVFYQLAADEQRKQDKNRPYYLIRCLVKGVMKCDFNRNRMCNFDGVESSAQFMWRVPRTGSKDFMDFPPLTVKGDYTIDRS